MDCCNFSHALSRREMLAKSGYGIGIAALHALLGRAAAREPEQRAFPNFPPRAKRVIFLFQAGGPSQLDLMDYKPGLKDRFNQDIPPSVFGGQRVTGMVAHQDRFPVAPSMYEFKQYGESGMWFSELLPHHGKIADEICVIRSMRTEAINHDPAITFIQTGSQLPGRPSMGSWIDYGLGSENENLPGFVVLNSLPSNGMPDQGLLARLWGAGFLPSRYQGVQLRSAGDPVLHLTDAPGITRERRKTILDGLSALNTQLYERVSDPEIETRIAQYEMAFRMQASVPELADTSGEPEHVYKLYGEDARKPGTFAANCLLARRLAERNVRFIQLYHRGWDHHGGLTQKIPSMARDVDQASAALVLDLKQRGMLDDTLVIWGGEFGRTPYAQGTLKPDNYGRDHHGRVFSIWMAGGGIKRGHIHGSSDEYGFNIADGGVHIHDLQATILHLLGIDHEKLTYRFQGRQFRLTDVSGKVVREVLA
ncbi:MAG: DUF1501 domain-containing protein [Bryobacteraceae bacterium]